MHIHPILDKIIFPIYFGGTSKQDYRDAMYVLNNANCITIKELQPISENEREKSCIIWWVILYLILFFHWKFSSSSLTKFVFFFYSNNDTMEMNHDGLGESIDFESESIILCLDATFDNKTSSYDEGRDLTDDMLQTNKNTFTFLSPLAQKLHQKISNNSPSKLKMDTQNTIWASWKNMVDNIQYIIEHEILPIMKELGNNGMN